MAYNSGYNPDALPAHAEPEQAAQLIFQQEQQNPAPQPHRTSISKPQPYASNVPSAYGTKPPPPTPQVYQRPPQAYNTRPPPQNASYQHNFQQNVPYNNVNSQQYSMSPPPPQNHGFGPPPQNPHGRSPPLSRPPPTPAPGGRSSSADASLFPLFKAVDKTGTGQLSEKELKAALVNGDWTSFDPHTVKMMIRMFDVDKSGTIGFDEFCGLWGFLAAWRGLFDRFDEDRSGYISFDEYTKALVAFGYHLSPNFVNILYRTYDKSGENSMSFDLFVQSCIILKRMTDVFKKYDDDRDGYITLSFEEFLTEILRQR